MSSACSLLHLAEEDDRQFAMGDYESAKARWCPGCGDHSVLTSVQRLLTAGRCHHDVSGPSQGLLKEEANARFIVHYQGTDLFYRNSAKVTLLT